MELNGSLTTMEFKKPHPSRLVGGVQTQNGLDKNSRGITQEQGIRGPHQAPRSGFQC